MKTLGLACGCRQRRHRKKHPASNVAESHLTDAMLRKSATMFWERLATCRRGQILNQQPCSSESCHSVTLVRVLLFVKAAPFFAKKVTAAISFSEPRKHWLLACGCRQRRHRKKHPASNVAAAAPHRRHVAKACDNNSQNNSKQHDALANIRGQSWSTLRRRYLKPPSKVP